MHPRDMMSKKCRAYSKSKLGLQPPDNRVAFYAGWEAAKRSFVGLTDEEIAANWGEPYSGSTMFVQRFARAIEAKLRSKNT